MVRFIIRAIGFLLFAASFIALIADGIRSIAEDAIVLTPLGQTWFSFHRESLNTTQAVVQRYLHPYIWDPGLQTVLLWPTFAVGGVVAILLLIIGRRRRRRPSVVA